MTIAEASSSIRAIWERCFVRVTWLHVLVTGALVYIFDAFFTALHTAQFWSGPVDWTAHIGTALLILNLLPWGWRRAILLPAVLGSFLIDLDHIPQFFHDYVLLQGYLPRPCTHSLTTSATFCLAGLLLVGLWRRGGLFLVGFGLGTVLHFVRDLAESPGVGIPMLWPFTKHIFGYRHSLYLVLVGVLIALNLARLALQHQGLLRAQPPSEALSA